MKRTPAPPSILEYEEKKKWAESLFSRNEADIQFQKLVDRVRKTEPKDYPKLLDSLTGLLENFSGLFEDEAKDSDLQYQEMHRVFQENLSAQQEERDSLFDSQSQFKMPADYVPLFLHTNRLDASKNLEEEISKSELFSDHRRIQESISEIERQASKNEDNFILSKDVLKELSPKGVIPEGVSAVSQTETVQVQHDIPYKTGQTVVGDIQSPQSASRVSSPSSSSSSSVKSELVKPIPYKDQKLSEKPQVVSDASKVVPKDQEKEVFYQKKHERVQEYIQKDQQKGEKEALL